MRCKAKLTLVLAVLALIGSVSAMPSDVVPEGNGATEEEAVMEEEEPAAEEAKEEMIEEEEEIIEEEEEGKEEIPPSEVEETAPVEEEGEEEVTGEGEGAEEEEEEPMAVEEGSEGETLVREDEVTTPVEEEGESEAADEEEETTTEASADDDKEGIPEEDATEDKAEGEEKVTTAKPEEEAEGEEEEVEAATDKPEVKRGDMGPDEEEEAVVDGKEEMPEKEDEDDKEKKGSEEDEEATDEADSTVPEGGSSECPCRKALAYLTELLEEMNAEMKELRQQIGQSCAPLPTKEVTLNATCPEVPSVGEEQEEPQEIVVTTTEPAPTVPPIPTECPVQFNLVANACLHVISEYKHWKSWGDAQAFCQSINGTLVAPYRFSDLRKHLNNLYSNVFWVGGKLYPDDKKWKWLNGNDVTEDEWDESHPKLTGSRNCIHLGPLYHYKASNHYCGERFAFICGSN